MRMQPLAVVLSDGAIVMACASSAPASMDWRSAPIAACVNEDGSGGQLPCYWDAAARRNGYGDSYVVNVDRTITRTR